MTDVSVNLDELIRQVNMLKQESAEMDAARKRLALQYEQLGRGWNDEKYKALGVIVTDCNHALRNIEKTLLQGQKILCMIIAAVREYENIQFQGMASGERGMSLHFTAEEVNSRWQTGVESINEQINNYREALTEKGVPDCPWLDRVLAEHRAAMLKQEHCDLELAGGKMAPESYNPSEFYQSPVDYSAFYDGLAADFRTYCLTGTNPNFEQSPVYRDNCQRCVPTCELRRRGVEAEVYPSSHGSDHLSYHPFDVWKDAQVFTADGSGIETIQERMRLWGDSARAQVVVFWDHGFGTDGHTFMAEQRNGETFFFDPQTGKENVADYFEDVIPNTTQFCRIDDLQTTDYIQDCYFERRGD